MRSSRYTYALVALAVSLVTSIASAQSPRFGVWPVDPSNVANVEDVIAHAINKHGDVVGEITFTNSGETHAFVYF